MSISIQANNLGIFPSIFEKINQTLSPNEDSSLYGLYQDFRIDLRTYDLIRDFSADHVFNWIQSSLVWGLTVSAFKFLGVAFGCYFVVSSILSSYTYTEFIEKNSNLSRTHSMEKLFPKETMLKHCALGVLAVPTNFLINFICSFVEKRLQAPLYQDAGVMLSKGGLSGNLMAFFACVLAPLGEEIIFRGKITDLFNLHAYDAKAPETTLDITKIEEGSRLTKKDKLLTILKTSLIFGFIHMSPFQGWANIVVFVTTTLAGIGFALLKEGTGDLWAPVTMHALSNTMATLQLRFG